MNRAWFSIVLIVSTPSFASADWLQFRGPGGLGVAPDKATPSAWSADSNIAWKFQMPGRGASSPIVVGDKVLLTCYTGYGAAKDQPGEQKDLKRHLLCLDRKSGKQLWTRDMPGNPPEPNYAGFQALHGYASNTPASDGKSVFVFYGKSGVHAYDLDGTKLWSADVGTGTYYWGVGPSPILYKDMVIVNAGTESNSMIALDKKTGKEVWNAKGIKSSWNTPILVKLPNGATELCVATEPKMIGLDPDTGKELWHADTYNWYVCPSLVANDGIVYGLQHSTCVAVKAGGRGNVTESHVLWKKNFGAVVTSPLFHDGQIYWAWGGTANCVKASDGSVVYKERMKGSDSEFYASPLFADGKLYYTTRESGVFVVEAGAKFKLLAHNTLDKSVFNAGPAVSNSQLFLRSDQYLYCIGKEK